MGTKLSEQEREKVATLFIELVEVFRRLREPEKGCPWDLKQTHHSLKSYLVEECYEAIDAIDQVDQAPEKLVEELGDVLLQVMLHCQIAMDNGAFRIEDVVSRLTEKMIVRHPHVFGEVKVSGTEDVLNNWEKIKRYEKPSSEPLLAGVPRALPALQQAHRIGEKVARVGFDWGDAIEVKEKVVEELGEFLSDLENQKESAKSELGDLLFTIAQLARKLGYSAEEVLADGNQKFRQRFGRLEEILGGHPENYSREELEAAWQKVKAEEDRK